MLAEYKDFKVTQGMVNFQKRAANLAGDNTNIEASDYTKVYSLSIRFIFSRVRTM